VIENGEEAEDLLSLIKEEVSNRRFAEVVRLEVHSSMPFSCANSSSRSSTTSSRTSRRP
jgi:polyphosphate kinase